MTDVQVRLDKLWVSLYRPDEHDRNNAAGALYRFLQDNNIHPTEIALSMRSAGPTLIERNQRAISILQDQLKLVHQENVFLRRHASDDVLRQAQRAANVDFNQWLDLKDLLLRCWQVDDLPDDWRRRLAKLAEVSVVEVDRWETGYVEVPERVFALVRKAEPVTPSAPEPEVQTRPEPAIQSPRPPKRKRRSKAKRSRRTASKPQTSSKESEIMKGLRELGEATVSKLSYHLYNQPDINSNVYDTLDRLRKKGLADRRFFRRDRYVNFLTDQGLQAIAD